MKTRTMLLLLAAAAVANTLTPTGADLAATTALCLFILPVAWRMDKENNDNDTISGTGASPFSG